MTDAPMTNYKTTPLNSFSGIPLIETEYATALPSGRPFCDDTKAFVDHMERLGLIERRPAAFMLNGRLHIHPDMMRKLQAELTQRLDAMAFQAFRGGL